MVPAIPYTTNYVQNAEILMKFSNWTIDLFRLPNKFYHESIIYGLENMGLEYPFALILLSVIFLVLGDLVHEKGVAIMTSQNVQMLK